MKNLEAPNPHPEQKFTLLHLSEGKWPDEQIAKLEAMKDWRVVIFPNQPSCLAIHGEIAKSEISKVLKTEDFTHEIAGSERMRELSGLEHTSESD